jgi:hypothetical protein
LVLLTKKATATSQGVVLLTFSCTGDKSRLCRGRIDLDVLGTPAGSNTFKLRPNKRSIVGVKLTRKAFRLLQAKKKFIVNVTVAFKKSAVGNTMDYKTSRLPLSAPKPKAPAQGK